MSYEWFVYSTFFFVIYNVSLPFAEMIDECIPHHFCFFKCQFFHTFYSNLFSLVIFLLCCFEVLPRCSDWKYMPFVNMNDKWTLKGIYKHTKGNLRFTFKKKMTGYESSNCLNNSYDSICTFPFFFFCYSIPFDMITTWNVEK